MSSSNLLPTFKGFLDQVYHNKPVADEQKVFTLLNKLTTPSIAASFAPAYFVFDYSKRQYLLYADAGATTGYHPSAFLDGGLEMLMHVYQKDDFKIYDEKVFTRNCEFLKSVPQETHDDYMFSCTFRIQNKEGALRHIWQKGFYVTSPQTGLPAYSLGVFQDVSHIKTDAKMVHTIEKIGTTVLDNEVIEVNHFFPEQEERVFTKKETEVLLQLAEGLSTKEIADKMNVAETTIITHRKNMMQKSNTKNAVQLVVYGISNNII